MRPAVASLLQAHCGAALWRANEVALEDRADATISSGFLQLDHEFPGGGWPRGQLVELLFDDAGIGELSMLVPALAQVAKSGRSGVWILPADVSKPNGLTAVPYAPALTAADINLARMIFVKPATLGEGLWAFEQSLRAEHLGAVVGHINADGRPDRMFKALQRLHVLAQRNRALAFVLRDNRCALAPSPAALRLQLAATSGYLKVTLLKRRGRPLLDPIELTLRPTHWTDARISLGSMVAAMNTTPATRSLSSARALDAARFADDTP